MKPYQFNALSFLQFMAGLDVERGSRFLAALKNHWIGQSTDEMPLSLKAKSDALIYLIKEKGGKDNLSNAFLNLSKSQSNYIMQEFIYLMGECISNSPSYINLNDDVYNNYFNYRYRIIEEGIKDAFVPLPAIVFTVFDVNTFMRLKRKININNAPGVLFGSPGDFIERNDMLVMHNGLDKSWGIESYTALGADGVVELCHSGLFADGRRDQIDLYRAEQRIFKIMSEVLGWLRQNGFVGPYGFKLAIIGAKDSEIRAVKNGRQVVFHNLKKPNLEIIQTPIVPFDTTGKLEISTKRIFDEIWSHYGLLSSLSFSPEGRFIPDGGS